jgi:transcriptional regulator with XRE-family HTH domain
VTEWTSHRSRPADIFDGTAFARVIVERRHALGRSTRDIARRAGLSQPYVVALERPRDGRSNGPVPTVDALVGLAEALELSPVDLLGNVLVPAGRHVVVLRPSGVPLSLDALRAGSGLDGPWIWASSREQPPITDVVPIDLRRDDLQPYVPSRITAAFEREARAVAEHLRARRVGCAFVETSDVLASLDDPGTLLTYEHEWGDLVRDTVRRHGGHDVWNVCVYTDEALLALDDPCGAVVDLLRSHDTVWRPTPDGLATGPTAARAALTRFRPDGVGRTAWHRRIDAIVDDLAISA